jgi:CheY-like chemotaxis protein
MTPIQVLIASRDSRYLKVTSFLLERRGFSVEMTRKLTELLDTVDRAQPNVLVLDASDWSAPAARRIAALGVLYPHVAVVAVSDEPGPLGRTSALDKWAAVEELQESVEVAYLVGAGAAAGR